MNEVLAVDRYHPQTLSCLHLKRRLFFFLLLSNISPFFKPSLSFSLSKCKIIMEVHFFCCVTRQRVRTTDLSVKLPCSPEGAHSTVSESLDYFIIICDVLIASCLFFKNLDVHFCFIVYVTCTCLYVTVRAVKQLIFVESRLIAEFQWLITINCIFYHV